MKDNTLAVSALYNFHFGLFDFIGGTISNIMTQLASVPAGLKAVRLV